VRATPVDRVVGPGSLAATTAVVVALGVATAVAPALAVAALAAVALLVFPELLLLAAAVALEEQTTAGGSYEQANILVRVGGETFYGGEVAGLRVVTLVTLAAAAAVILRHRVSWRTVRGPDAWLVLGLVVLTTVTAFAATGDPIGSLTAASPWVVLGCSMIIGRRLAEDRTARHRAERVVVALVAAKAALGLLIFTTGRGLYDPNGLLSIVYFDGTTPMVAGAVLVVCLIARRAGSALATGFVVLMSAIVIVVAMRRTSVVALAATVLVVSLVGRQWKALSRLWAGALLAVVAAAVLVPAAFAAFAASIERAWSTVLSGTGESSAQGHVEDIRIAWEAVKASPIRGLGYGQEPPVGLVGSVLSDRLYVHNELFQVWLQLGLAGAVLSTALIAVLFVRGARTMRRGGDPMTLAAAVVCVGLPFSLVWFPHLSTTFRWPILVGVSSGLLLARRSTDRPTPGPAASIGVPADVAVETP